MNKTLLKLQPWLKARRRFRRDSARVQMARELRMDAKKLGTVANENQQTWKVPRQEFVVQCHFKRFSRSQPTQVRSLEQLIESEEMRRKLKQERKLA